MSPKVFSFKRRFKERQSFSLLEIVGSTLLTSINEGSTYSSTLSAIGGVSPYEFTAINSLPGWLSLSTAGLFSGTASSGGLSTFSVQVQDSHGSTARQSFSLTVTSTQLQLSGSTRLNSAIVDSTYSHTFTSTGGTPPYSSYSAVTSLPAGFSLTSSGGLTGTLTSSGMSSFTIQVKDNAGSTASRQFSVVALTNDAHAYFDGLVARDDFWKGLSFRPISSIASTAGGYSSGTLSNGFTNPYFNNQLLSSTGGGYRAGSSKSLETMTFLNYNPSGDTHAQAQDAAKMSVPAFDRSVGNPWSLNISVSSGSSFITVNAAQASSGLFANNLGIRLDNEIVKLEAAVGWDPAQPAVNTPRRLAAGSTNVWELRVLRGQYGTAASTHAAGTAAPYAVNSIPGGYQIRYPLRTTDDHRYLITWDVFYPNEWIGVEGAGNKFFQFSDYNDNIWLETKMDFTGTPSDNHWPECSGWSTTTYVSDFSVRSYNNENDGSTTWSTSITNMLGPGSSRALPLSPPVGTFCVPVGKWVRLFWYIDQRANDWDPVTLWVADESREAVKLLDAIKVSVRVGTGTTANQIYKWWLEWNDSNVDYQHGTTNHFRDLPLYIRNLAVLQDPPAEELTSTGLLQKPVG